MDYKSISPYIKSHLELQREWTVIELAPSPYFSVVFVLFLWTCLQSLMNFQQWLFKILRKQNVRDGHMDTRTTWKQHTHHKVCGGIKNYFMNTIRLSNYMDPFQVQCSVGLIWVQTVCKGYHKTTNSPLAPIKAIVGIKCCDIFSKLFANTISR